MHELFSLGNKAPSMLLLVKYLTLYFHEWEKGVSEIKRISWTTGAGISSSNSSFWRIPDNWTDPAQGNRILFSLFENVLRP